MSKKLKIFSLKIHKGVGFLITPKIFLNKGNERKKNYMEGVNSKIKIIKMAGPLN